MSNFINPVKPSEDLGFLLWQTNMIWQRQMNRALDKIKLTHTQFAIMAALNSLLKISAQVTQKEIAFRSKTDTMMVSKVLRTLQKKGLIERKEHETDTRAKCVYFTKQGLITLKNASEITTEANQLFFERVNNKSKFKEELKQLIK